MREANKGAEKWLPLHREDLQRITVAREHTEKQESLLYHKRKLLRRLHLSEDESG